ncbi:MAG TPA: glycoside hydrolase family 2 TIM barrel-domain containing protein, partial [Candidatus Limiplasma sp.]|nr:glycoside hydrolase family 2 TIM barrel-domain containing protein [Candidatus Limiplasma sp.]
MNELILNGDWTLCGAPEKTLPQTPDALQTARLSRIAATVPGNVELDLYRAGLCPDPFMRENLYQFRPYEFYGWWYERSFTLPEGFLSEPVELFLGGVDTFATVFINGCEVGRTDNMMMEYTLDATPYLREGENRMAIRIDSAINRARKLEYPVGVRGPGYEHTDEMLRVRKPGHCFGWDIAPRFVSAGIWRTVALRRRASTAIRETYWATLAANEAEATLLCKCRFTTDAESLDGFAFHVLGECGNSRFEKTLHVKFVSDEMTLIVPNPRLWWPRGYGDANLYTVTLTLVANGTAVDSKTERIGIRTADVEARFETGDAGEFRVLLNGTPILVKGANWVPLDAFHSRDAERVERALRLFTDCGCNMVRCWGGNVYEDTRFFDLCDQEGLLVWQDFALACGLYPQDDAFARAVEEEAAQIVRKHRNHPSLLLWCGDNEVDAMYACFGYRQPHVRENRLSRETLPRVAASHDPMRFYLPSSPYIPQPLSGELSVPEQHNWGPRDYFKGDFYRHSSARFISEIGYHGCPSVGSLCRFLDSDHLWPMNNSQWDAHNTEYTRCVRDRGYDRNELMADQVRDMFGETPEQLQRFAMLSQISQAEALKFFVETV